MDTASLVAEFSPYSCLLNTTASKTQEGFVLDIPLKRSLLPLCSGLAGGNKEGALKYSESGHIDELNTGNSTLRARSNIHSSIEQYTHVS